MYITELAAIIPTVTNKQKVLTEKMKNCKNCNNQITEKYCSNCGQSASIKRIDNHYIFHEIQHLLHFEKGIFFTAKQLFIKPGISIREYIVENRNKLMKPIPFLILTSLLFTFVGHFFNPEKIYGEQENPLFDESHISDILLWIQTHFGYANIIMAIFIAFGVRLLFRKYSYNLFEITTLLCFIMGQAMLYFTIEAFFINFLSKQAFMGILSLIAFAYPTWAIGQFYDKSKVSSYVKAFFAYLIGYLLFYVSVIAVGLTIDLIAKH